MSQWHNLSGPKLKFCFALFVIKNHYRYHMKTSRCAGNSGNGARQQGMRCIIFGSFCSSGFAREELNISYSVFLPVLANLENGSHKSPVSLASEASLTPFRIACEAGLFDVVASVCWPLSDISERTSFPEFFLELCGFDPRKFNGISRVTTHRFSH